MGRERPLSRPWRRLAPRKRAVARPVARDSSGSTKSRSAGLQSLDRPRWPRRARGATGGTSPGSATFDSQVSTVMPVAQDGREAFVFVGDRWIPEKLGDSAPVWLPMHTGDGDPRALHRHIDGFHAAATACSTGHGWNVARPAWLEKQPCVHPRTAVVSSPASAASAPAAGLPGPACSPLAPDRSPAPRIRPVASYADGAARPSMAPHPSSVVKKMGSPNRGATVHNPGAPSGTSRHTFALASPSG